MSQIVPQAIPQIVPQTSNQPSTIAEAEAVIQQGLERLRDAPFNDTVMSALNFLAPRGYRVVAQMEEEGRKKRSTASINNWNHATGEIVLFFEPVQAEPVQAGLIKSAIVQAGPVKAETVQAEPVRADSVQSAPVSAQGAMVEAAASAVPAPVPPARLSMQDEVRECCEAMVDAEKLGRPFYAIKWFRDIFLPERGLGWATSIQDRQRVLNRTIQSGYIETRSIPNPNNAAFPTTTLQLNREKAAPLLGTRIAAAPLPEQAAAE